MKHALLEMSDINMRNLMRVRARVRVRVRGVGFGLGGELIP